MLSIFSNDATAAHLAILAVAPLALFECRGGSPSVALIWLAAIAAIWVFMAPVKRWEEHSDRARARVAEGVLADPVSWVFLLLLGYSALVALNGGVALAYDGEQDCWLLAGPASPSLPGGVAGAGGATFAAALVASVIYLGVVHSQDARRAVDFAILAALLLAAWTAFACRFRHGAVGAHAVACGLLSMTALAALCSGECATSRAKEVLSVAGFIGCLSALLLARQPVAASVFAVALLLQTAFAVVLFLLQRKWLRPLRIVVMVVAAIAVSSGIFWYFDGDWSALRPEFALGSAVPVLNGFALSAWESSPWAGVGVGAFPLAAKLAAAPADWAVLGPLPEFYRNWWTAALAERGMVGALVLLVSVGSLAFAWFRRVRLGGRRFLTPALAMLPLAAVAVAAVLFFDGSAAQTDALVAFSSLAAVSVNGGT